jgi:RimJ/RimL family protein N-acetyltransferase
MTASRLKKPWGNEIYGMVGAFTRGRCIGTTSYTISPHRLGILCQVLTDEEFRKRGVARAVVGEVVDTFRRHQSRAVYLASGRPFVRRFYQSFGFEFAGAMGERHAFKLTLTPDGSEEVLFRSDQQASLRGVASDDQASLCALFNAGNNAVVKHYELGCYLGSHFEGEFYTLQKQEEASGYRAVVLEGEEAVLGMGTVMASRRRQESHRGVLDVLVHPNHRQHTASIIDRLANETRLTTLVAYAGVEETERGAILEQAGFTPVGTFCRHLEIGTDSFDLVAYEWNA